MRRLYLASPTAGRVAHPAGNIGNALGTAWPTTNLPNLTWPEMSPSLSAEEADPSNVPTWRCGPAPTTSSTDRALSELVVKESTLGARACWSGGRPSSKIDPEEFTALLRAGPDNYIAQPTLAVSTCPTFVSQGVCRAFDLRPSCCRP